MSKLKDEEWVDLVKLTIKSMHEHLDLRLGQSYMNSLFVINKNLHDQIERTEFDCFYDDNKIINFINFLEDANLKPKKQF